MMTCSTETRRCARCGTEKALDDFPVNRAKRLGRGYRCKPCAVEVARERARANPERERERRRRNYLRHVEANRAKALRRRNRNVERARESARAWRAANRDRVAAYNLAYRAANVDLYRRLEALRRQDRPEERSATERRRRARKVGVVSLEQLDARWSFFGGRCWLCRGAADTWDHVKPLSKGGLHLAANLRPACRRCNARKGARWPLAS